MGAVEEKAVDGGPAVGSEIFISYSRRDLEFVRRLHLALEELGRGCWIDWHDIPPTAEWMREVRGAIESAEAFVFVISPDSVVSDVCREEIEHAASLNKRIVPIVSREVPAEEVPEAARTRNWIFFTDQSDFEASVRSLTEALDTDPDWVRDHTRLQVRALEWDEHDRDRSFVLRGRDLSEAERWLSQVDERKDPQPTVLHTEYILASRRAATRGQRIWTGALAAGLIVALALAAFALLQRNRAENEAHDSRSRELAASALLGLATDPERSLLLSVEAERTAGTPEAEQAIRQSLEETSYIRRVLRGHHGQLLDAAFSPDGSEVVTASADGTDRIWKPATGKLIQVLRSDHGEQQSAGFSPDGRYVVTGAQDGYVQIWRPPSSKPVASWKAHEGRVKSARYSPDGRLVLTAGSDGTVRLWDARSSKPLRVLFTQPNRKAIYDAEFSPDGKLVISASASGIAYISDTRTGQVIRRLSAGGAEVNSASFSPDGRQAITSSDDHKARIWSVHNRHLQFVLPEADDLLYSASYSPDGRYILTAGLDGAARLYKVLGARRPRLISTFLGHTGGVVRAAFSPDGRYVVTAGDDRTARVWRSVNDDTIKLLRSPGDVVSGDVSPDGARILTTGEGDFATIWDATGTRRLLSIRPETGGYVWSGEFSPDGRRILTVGDDGVARIWDADSGKRLSALCCPAGFAYSATWSPDGSRVATAGAVGSDSPARYSTVRIWESRSGELLRTLGRVPGDISYNAVDWNPDGDSIATGGPKARLWSLSSGKPRVLRGHTDFVGDVAFSPDGRYLATASEDNTGRIWNAATGRPLGVLNGHSGGVLGIAFSRDGERIATASADRTIRVWEVPSGEQLDVLHGFGDDVLSVAFGLHGDRVLGASYDNTARIMRCSLCVSPDRLLKRAESRVDSVLLPEDRAHLLAESSPSD